MNVSRFVISGTELAPCCRKTTIMDNALYFWIAAAVICAAAVVIQIVYDRRMKK